MHDTIDAKATTVLLIVGVVMVLIGLWLRYLSRIH